MKRQRSRGSVALKACPGSAADKAYRISSAGPLSCSKDAVSSWERGDRAPGEDLAKQIEAALGVEWLWWREKLQDAATEGEPLGPVEPEAGAATPVAVITRADALLADVDTARRDAQLITDPASKIRALEQAAGILKTLQALVGALQSERAVLDNPHMKRICERVMRALEPFPDAAKACRDAFAPQEEPN